MFWLLIVFGVLVALSLVLTYAVAPLAVLKKLRQPAHMGFVVVDPATLPEEAAGFLERESRALEAAGFERVAVVAGAARASWAALLVNRAAGDWAAVVRLAGLSFTDLRTVTADGLVFGTSNLSSLRSIHDTPPGHRPLRLPQVESVRRLAALHRARVVRDAPGAVHVLPAPGDEVRAFGRAATETYPWHVERGMYVLDGDVYRPTVKGAYLTSWRLMFPFRQLRAARILRTARAEEAALAPLAGRPAPAPARVAHAAPLPSAEAWEVEVELGSRRVPDARLLDAVHAYRAGGFRRGAIGTAATIGSFLVLLPVVVALRGRQPHFLLRPEVWFAFVVGAEVENRLRRRDMERLGLMCAACRKPLLKRTGALPADGRCPACGAEAVLTPAPSARPAMG